MRAGDVLDQRFQVERLAGAGGMGHVFRATDLETGRPVALKVMRVASPRLTGRFAREARILAEVSHPGIVAYVAHGIAGAGEAYLAMEWLEGESLSDRLARGSLSVAETVLVGLQLARAVGALHQRGIVHRDLKPSNIVLHHGGIDRLKLLDLGIARVLTGDHTFTTSGAMLGTAGYMAPEQARGDEALDARADVYAIGCVLFKCLTGRNVFEGDDPLAVLLRVVLEEPPRASALCPGLAEDLDDLIHRTLAKEADERPADANALIAELGALVGAERSSLPPSLTSQALTAAEARVLFLVLARVGAQADARGSADDARGRALRAAVERHRGRIHVLADGSLLVSLSDAPPVSAPWSSGAPADIALRAARCASALASLHPDAPVALVSGRAVMAARSPFGEVIDRGVQLLASAGPPGVRVDEATAGLLEGRFDLPLQDGVRRLAEERDVGLTTRTLLGRATPCVGRERELALLEATFAQCVDDQVARVVLITGPAGSGKSRLALELLERVRAGGTAVEVLVGGAEPVAAGSPLAALAQALRRAARIHEGDVAVVRQMKLHLLAARRLGRDHDKVAEVVRVTEFLGALCGVEFDEPSVQLDAARRDAGLMGDQVKRAFVDWLRAECRERPVLLVLEDLHWGDRATIAFVDAALRALQELPCMVVALARPELHDMFPDAWADRDLQQLRLGALTRKAAERLARHALAERADDATVAMVTDRAGGNPFLLEELVRAVAQGRTSELPDTVLAMVQARLDAYDPAARRVLRAASIFGDVFWLGGVEALLGRDAWTASESLARMVEQEVVVRGGASRFPFTEELAFRHDLVREAAYRTLTDEDAQLGHRLASAWLERAGERDAMVLASHCDLGGEKLRAAAWYRASAEQALEISDFEQALARADRASACGASGVELGRLHLLRAEAKRWRADPAGGEVSAKAAMDLLEGDGAWWLAAGELAHAAGRLAHDDELESLAGQLLSRWPATPGRPHLTAANRTALRLYFAGRHQAADALVERVADARAGAASDPAALAQAESALAARALRRGDTLTYLDHVERAIGCFERIGDLRSACNSQVNAGYARMQLGAYEEAEHMLQGALAAAERLALGPVILAAKHNLGLVLARRGHLAGGISVEREAADDFARQGAVRGECASRAYLAILLTEAGDALAAERAARAAVRLAEAGSPPLLPLALATLGGALLARGATGEARAVSERAYAALTAMGTVEEGEVFVRLIRAECAHRSGDAEIARETIADAARRLHERANRIPDGAARHRLLSAIPEHARTLALARAWVGAEQA